MSRKGDTWNESETYRDPVTLRSVRRVTTAGAYNYHPAYHTHTAWTGDGKRCVFITGRSGRTAVMGCDAASGDITQLTEWHDGWAVGKPPGVARGFVGGIGHACLDRGTGWVYYTAGTGLNAVHVESLEERMLVEDSGEYAYGMPTVSADGRWVAVPSNIIPREFADMDRDRPLTGAMVREIYARPGNSRMQLVRIPTAGDDAPEVVYDEPGCRGNHLQYSPVDPDLLHTDRDFAPGFWSGSDGVRNRVWLYRIGTRELVEQPSPSGRTFQVHSVWNCEGTEVLYHCPGGPGRGYVIGANDLEGNNIAEFTHDSWTYYGHVSAVAGRKAIMIDGNITDDLIMWIHYDDPARMRLEVICRHGTDWGGHEGQFPHPHPQCSPEGRWIVYNVAFKGRSDVVVVEV